jgi:hypothetical protein
MMQEFSSISTLETSSSITAKNTNKAARERARADIRVVLTERGTRIREAADKGEPPYLEVADALPGIAEAHALSQGEVNQLAGNEVAAFLRSAFEVKNRKVELPPNPGGAKTAASYERVKQGPDREAGLDDPEPES